MGEPWFGVRKFGLGISPKTVAGWISTAVFMLAMMATPWAVMAFHGPLWAIYVGFAGLLAVFLILVGAKSDGCPLRWRLGGR